MSDLAQSDPGAGSTAVNIAALNEKYRPLGFAQRIEQLYRDFDPGQVMVTSSFAATSAYFLHIISRIRPQQTIFFIDTGYHFPETLSYKDYLIGLYGLVVTDVRPEAWKHDFTAEEQTYKSDPDFCCSINKVEPLDEVKKDFRVWVSSLMRWQTPHRAGLDVFEERGGIIKFYPMVDVGKDERDAVRIGKCRQGQCLCGGVACCLFIEGVDERVDSCGACLAEGLRARPDLIGLSCACLHDVTLGFECVE